MIIGLTGGSGCGKSCGARVFAKAGFVVLDFDKIAREVCSAGSECLEEIKIHFGNEIILPDGSLNRQALGAIVFADEKLLSILTKITHKYILKETDALIEEQVIVRDRSRIKGCEGTLRITLGKPEENDRMLAIVDKWK